MNDALPVQDHFPNTRPFWAAIAMIVLAAPYGVMTAGCALGESCDNYFRHRGFVSPEQATGLYWGQTAFSAVFVLLSMFVLSKWVSRKMGVSLESHALRVHEPFWTRSIAFADIENVSRQGNFLRIATSAGPVVLRAGRHVDRSKLDHLANTLVRRSDIQLDETL